MTYHPISNTKTQLFTISLLFACVTPVLAEVSLCSDRPLAVSPNWSNEYRGISQTLTLPFLRCKPVGQPHQSALPYTTQGTTKCSTETLLRQTANGCSGPGLNTDQKRFTAACNEHDKCYSTPGQSKQRCDYNFKQNLRYTCKFYQKMCLVQARLFFLGVKIGADKAYQIAQNWGNNHCQ